MYTDLFANPSRDYVVPTITPCSTDSGSEANLEFIKEGIGITSGSKILSNIDFGELKIPVESYSNESKIIRPGEVIFIQGLTKGLLDRKQGFTIPSLISDNISLNPFFYYIDLSINYNSSFKNVNKDIDASASYLENISIVDALNISFGDAGIKISTNYDASCISFIGDQEGYDFTISNVVLNIIDSSQNSDSPFPNGVNPSSIVLIEDPSKNVPNAKYPNTAMQGIIIKGIYPNMQSVCAGTTEIPQNFLFINHVTDWVTICEPVSVNYDSNVSTNLVIQFDPSTFIGIMPNIGFDFSIGSYTFNYDISLNAIVIVLNPLPDPSTDISNLVIDNSIMEYYNIMDSSISDSSLYFNNIFESGIFSSHLEDNYLIYSDIKDSELIRNGIEISEILGSEIEDSSILNSHIDDSSVSHLAPSDYLAYYSFDNNIIGIADVSPNTWIPTYVDGADGSALYVDGNVILYPGFSNPTDFTVSFWVKNGTHPTNDVVFEMASSSVPNDESIRISISQTGDLTAIIKDTATEISTAQDISTNFHFIILTKSAGSYSLYVDDPITSKWNSSSGLQPNLSGTLNSIGSDIGGLDKIDAYIEGFRIYSRALSSSERQDLKDNYIDITPSTISRSKIGLSRILNSDISATYITDSSIENSVLSNSEIENSALEISSVEYSILGNSNIENSYVSDSSCLSSFIIDTSIDNSFCKLVFMEGGRSNLNIFNDSIISFVDSEYDNFYLCDLSSNVNVDFGYVNDSSVFSSYIADSSVIGSRLDETDTIRCFIEDSSISLANIFNNQIKESYIKDSSIEISLISFTTIENSDISDSSISGNSIINNGSTVTNSTIVNSFTNTFKLLSYIDPCTGEPVYNYVTEDDTLEIDGSSNIVSIYNTLIWDSSINNAVIYDSSIYNSLIEDSSLIRCTTYNCIFDPLTYFEDTRDILVDPSISASYQITKDTSIFYIKKTKRLDVGMSGQSTETVISAGDYLEWVTENNLWRKFGKLYAWTSSIDCDNPLYKNLITGFYVYNPHTFDTKIEYMVFK